MDASAQRIYPGASEIEDWLVVYLSKQLNISPNDIDVKAPFDRYGLDSLTAVLMTGDMEEWLGHRLDPTLLYDYPTVEAFVNYLTSPATEKDVQ